MSEDDRPPAMRQQLVDAAGGLGWQTFEHVLEVDVGIVPVESRGVQLKCNWTLLRLARVLLEPLQLVRDRRRGSSAASPSGETASTRAVSVR